MYISTLDYKNIGPISNLHIHFRKSANNTPIPLIIVGKNGSGKSVALSNIVDAFYELSDIVYDDATKSQRNGHQYYKAIESADIRIGEKYMLSHIVLEQGTNHFEYLFKSGELQYDECKSALQLSVDKNLDWGKEINYKKVIGEQEPITAAFENDIVCFFGPNRYMKPSWMGSLYHTENDIGLFSARPRFARHINNPITALNFPELTLQWLFDIIADSRADLEKMDNNQGYSIFYPNTNDLYLLSISRLNAEEIMSAILGEKVFFRMGNRSAGKRRFSIHKKQDGTTLVTSLDSLSTGQLALFNLFVTIIRYADNDNINLSHRLEDISGIVVIDEIELHLHSQLQREILPKLISLFPKVQFIITSHAPLFLLGMQEQFGNDNFDIIELPSGNYISVEQFSEFENAYKYLTETDRYRQEITSLIADKKDQPLIITEGSTDWKHMKAAYNSLLADPRCAEWLSKLEIIFLEYEPENSPDTAAIKLKMSESQLRTLCKQHSFVPQPRKIIFIADRDVNDAVKELNSNGQSFKQWGNNVFSFCLPIPSHRSKTPQICIEHYYTDDEIKTGVELDTGGIRRLFMGNEFDSDGFSINDEDFFCKEKNVCGEESIAIIDGANNKKVIHPREKPSVNYALPKTDFAKFILNKQKPFDQIDFSNFIPLFEIIRDILSQ